MSTNFEGKVVVVTGASGGMGFETSKMLALRGAKVSMCDIQEGPLNEAAEKIRAAGGDVIAEVVDVRDPKQIDAWLEKTVAKYGKIHGAANLAGVLPKTYNTHTIEDQTDDEWDRVIAINLSGVFYCMRSQLKHMVDGGSIVNASSVAGIIGTPKNIPYGASKFGVIGLTKCAALEVGPTRKIRVNAIAPGTIATPMYEQVMKSRGGEPIDMIQPIKRDGRPDEIASCVCWLLCDEASYITGQVNGVCGGYVC